MKPMNCIADMTSVCLEMAFSENSRVRVRVPVIPAGPDCGIDCFIKEVPQASLAPCKSLPSDHEPTIILVRHRRKKISEGLWTYDYPVIEEVLCPLKLL